MNGGVLLLGYFSATFCYFGRSSATPTFLSLFISFYSTIHTPLRSVDLHKKKKMVFLWLIFVILFSLVGKTDSRPLGTKLRVNGEKIELTVGVDKALCKAVIEEMVGEVKKHDLRSEGESDIFDTAGLAICLGVVNSHILTQQRASGKWVMRRKTATEKTAHENGEVTADTDMQGLLYLKEACSIFTEELQMEISEVIFKHVNTLSHTEIAETFCPGATAEKEKKKKKKNVKKQKAPKEVAENEFDPEKFDSFMETMNGDNSISEMLRRDRDSPDAALDEVDQRYILEGVDALKCSICKIAIEHIHNNTMALHDPTNEASIIAIVETAFAGRTNEDMLESADYTPGNPPIWSQEYAVLSHISKEKKKKKKKAQKGKKNSATWEVVRKGVHTYDEYADTVKRNVIFAKVCFL